MSATSSIEPVIEAGFHNPGNHLFVFTQDNIHIITALNPLTRHFGYLNAGANNPSFIQEAILATGSEKVAVFGGSVKVMPVPVALFSEDTMPALYDSHFDIDPLEELLFSRLKNYPTVLIYPVKSSIKSQYKSLNIPITFHHYSEPLLEYALSEYRNQSDARMYISVSGEEIVIIAFNQGLKLINGYKCQAPEDVLYFIMFACEQLQVNPLKDSIFICGISGKDDLFNLLETYIRNVNLLKRPGFYSYALAMNAIAEEDYFLNFVAPLCE